MRLLDVSKSGGAWPVIDEESGEGEPGGVWRSQQFIAGANNICGLVLPLIRVGDPLGDALIEIQSDLNNYPSGSVLASYYIPTNSISKVGVDYRVDFTAVQLVPGQKYHVCLKATEEWDATNSIYWKETFDTFSDYMCTGLEEWSIQTQLIQFDIETYYDSAFRVYQYADVKKSGGDTDESFETSYWWAQQFTPARPNISGVELNLKKLGAPTGTLTVEVQTNLANSPTGTVVTFGTVDVEDVSTTLGFIKILFPRYNFPLRGVKYWICVKGSADWDGTDGLTWRGIAGTYSDVAKYGAGDFASTFVGQMDMNTLYNVVPVDYDVTESLDTSPNLTVFDDIMDPQAIIKSAEEFSYTEDWYYPDVWELKLSSVKPGADVIELLGHIGWTDSNGVTHVGIIEKIEQPRSRDSQQWTISGRGSLALFARRRCIEEWATVATDGYDVQSDVAYETALRHYVTQEVISPSVAGRVISGVSLNVEDLLRGLDYNGDKCEKRVRGEPLLDVLTDLCQTSTLGCDLVWTGATATPTNKYTWRFDVYAGTDRRNSVKLSVNFSNVLSYRYAESCLNLATVEYVAGEGDGDTRPLTEVYQTATTGKDRFEDFIDAQDCTSEDLRAERGLEMLSQKVNEKTFEFDYNPNSQNAVYGVDFFVGDIITVSDPDLGVTMIDRVVTATTTYSSDGKTITIGMGTRPLDLLSLERIRRKRDGTGAKS